MFSRRSRASTQMVSGFAHPLRTHQSFADEFRSLRRLYFGAWIATIGSFGLSLLLLFIAERS
jgi:hypothetical protein